jgi:hypothetical protein
MATVKIDDVTKEYTEDVATVHFSWDGTAYKIDLSEVTKKEYDGRLAPLIEVAETVSSVRQSEDGTGALPGMPSPAPVSYGQLDQQAAKLAGKRTKEQNQAIRDWANGPGKRVLTQLGFPDGVKERGAIATQIVDAFEQEHAQ